MERPFHRVYDIIPAKHVLLEVCMYIAIGIGAIAAVALLVFFISRRKSGSSKDLGLLK